MKYLQLTIIFFLTFNISLQSQDAIVNYFEEYLDHEDFTTVYISAKMFDLMSKLGDNKNDEDFRNVVNELSGLRILVADTLPEFYFSQFNSKLEIDDYEILMKIRDKQDIVDILVKDKPNSDKIGELLMMVQGDTNFVFLSLIGNMSMETISKIPESLDIEGSEYLKNVKEN